MVTSILKKQAELRDKEYSIIPVNTLEEIHQYIDNRRVPSGFVCSVLRNDLRAACRKADNQNRVALVVIVKYLDNVAPAICWGSEEAFQNWIQMGEK